MKWHSIFPSSPKESVSFRIEVDSRHGSSVIRAQMIVPDVQGTFNGEAAPESGQSPIDRGFGGRDGGVAGRPAGRSAGRGPC